MSVRAGTILPRVAAGLVITLALVPVLAGLAGTLLPAFGHAPVLGWSGDSLAPWRDLAATPGIATSALLSLGTGIVATLGSLGLAACVTGWVTASAAPRRWERGLALLLAPPHAALALGLAFLLAPSGWLVRLISPELTGWTQPPDLRTVRDPWGLGLILGLMLKETPYLALMMIAAGNQVRARDHLAAARVMGYSHARAWAVVVWPLLYRQIRLPVLAVLAFSISVVDVALVLGPGHPAPLAVLAARWFSDPDLTLYPRAAAAAITLTLLTLAVAGLGHLMALRIGRLHRNWSGTGQRRTRLEWFLTAGSSTAVVIAGVSLACMAGLAVWSVAGPWHFPELWPRTLTGRTWAQQAEGASITAVTTLLLACISTALALAGCLTLLEAGSGRAHAAGGLSRIPTALLYLPLLVPQIGFLFGLQVLLVRLGWDGSLLTVACVHALFVLPYLHLSLAGPWSALDRRLLHAARVLGASRLEVFWRVRLPLLLRPLAIACAMGMSVSMALYLPTLFAGAGRVATLTTEAVTLSATGDRRIVGVHGVMLALLPFATMLGALLLPTLVYRHRRGLA